MLFSYQEPPTVFHHLLLPRCSCSNNALITIQERWSQTYRIEKGRTTNPSNKTCAPKPWSCKVCLSKVAIVT